MWIGLTGIGFVSCHSNTDYEETMEGRLVVLKEPYKCQNWCNGNRYKVVAHFVSNDNIPDSLSHDDSAIFIHCPYFRIHGTIPKEFQNSGVQTVSLSLKPSHPCGHTLEIGVPFGADSVGGWNLYKISCVNKTN